MTGKLRSLSAILVYPLLKQATSILVRRSKRQFSGQDRRFNFLVIIQYTEVKTFDFLHVSI